MNGDFGTIVGPDVDEFEAKMTVKMANLLNVTENRIFNLTVTEGEYCSLSKNLNQFWNE